VFKNVKLKIYRTIISSVGFYGCENCSLTLSEERRLRVSENRVLRRIFGLKRDEVTESWRKLHNDELHNLYFSSSIIRMIKSRKVRWAGHVVSMGQRKIYIEYWWECQKEGDHKEYLTLGGM
jgi:hypothetical protein